MLSVIIVHTIIISHHSGRLEAALDVCPLALGHDTESFLSSSLVLSGSIGLHFSVSVGTDRG